MFPNPVLRLLAEGFYNARSKENSTEQVVEHGTSQYTWLHVSMKVPMLVHVCQSLQNLKCPAADLRFWWWTITALHQLVQIAVLHQFQCN